MIHTALVLEANPDAVIGHMLAGMFFVLIAYAAYFIIRKVGESASASLKRK